MSLRPSEQAEFRRSSFKASVSAADGRRRRVSVTEDLRKVCRGNALRKKRCSGAEAAPHAQARSHPPDQILANLTQLAAGLYSDDSSMQFEAAREFRKLLSTERDPPIQEVVNCGVLPCFVQLLSREDYPQLQLEAAWALTNIASGSSKDTMLVVNIGAVPIFVKLLSSPNEDIREQAVWALGNVVGDSAKCRDIVLAHDALFPLLQLFNGNLGLSLLRTSTWCLSNFCRGGPNFEQVKPALLVLQQLIHSEDEEVLSDACWALSYLSRGNDDNANVRIQSVVETGACPRLVELLSHPSPSVLVPALFVVGSIAAGDDAHTQCLVDQRALPYLLNILLTNQSKSVKKEACWTISNTTAGNSEQIQAVIDANIIGPLVHLMHTAEFVVRIEAAWAISNASCGGTLDQIKYLVSQGCIKAFCDLLGHSDSRILTVCLEGLGNILKVGEKEKSSGACDFNIYAQMIEDADALDKIEDLQNSESDMVYQMAVHLLETFWVEEDDAMPSEASAPQTIIHNSNQKGSIPLLETFLVEEDDVMPSEANAPQTSIHNSNQQGSVHLLETFCVEEDDAMPSEANAPQTSIHNSNQQGSVHLLETFWVEEDDVTPSAANAPLTSIHSSNQQGSVHLLETFWAEEDDAMPTVANAPWISIHNSNQQGSVTPGVFKFG